MKESFPELLAGLLCGTSKYGRGTGSCKYTEDDYYTFDQDAYELIGDVTHKVFALGQKVRVRVADADTMLKTVDFVLAEDQEW